MNAAESFWGLFFFFEGFTVGTFSVPAFAPEPTWFTFFIIAMMFLLPILLFVDSAYCRSGKPIAYACGLALSVTLAIVFLGLTFQPKFLYLPYTYHAYLGVSLAVVASAFNLFGLTSTGRSHVA